MSASWLIYHCHQRIMCCLQLLVLIWFNFYFPICEMKILISKKSCHTKKISVLVLDENSIASEFKDY